MGLPILLCFSITYLVELLYYLFFKPSYEGNGPISSSVSFLILSAFVMWIPGLVALWAAKKEGFCIPIFSKPRKMYFLAFLSAASFSFLSTVFSIPFNQWNNPSFTTLASVILSSLIAGFFINSFFALGEELFWRGYLYKKLEKLGIIRSSLITGLLWGSWHIPLIILMGHNYPEYPIAGVFFMVLFCIAISPIFFWFRKKAGNVFVPAILHGTINAFGGLSFIVFKNPDSLLSSVGLGGIVAGFTYSLFFILRERNALKLGS